MTTKTSQIRDFLEGGGKPFAQIHQQIGGTDDSLLALLKYMQKRGELTIGDDEDQTITLRRSGWGERVSRKSKKPARAKKAKRAKPGPKAKPARPARKARRPYRRLAEKHATTNGAALHALALDNLVAAGIALRQACDDVVEDCALPPGFELAKQSYDRAAQIHDAAKSA